jgi:hypothetical protein
MRSKEEQERIVKRALSMSSEGGGDADVSEGRVIAYLIASEVLGCDIWFALNDSFNPDDGLAVFYADEIPFLKSKDAETLKEIHKVKLANGGGGRVTQ